MSERLFVYSIFFFPKSIKTNMIKLKSHSQMTSCPSTPIAMTAMIVPTAHVRKTEAIKNGDGMDCQKKLGALTEKMASSVTNTK